MTPQRLREAAHAAWVQVQHVVLASRQYSARLELFSSLARADNVSEVGSAANTMPQLSQNHIFALGFNT